MPLLLVPDLFVKNETVSGISGNTQGVIRAINPPKNPRKNIAARLLSAASESPHGETVFFKSIEEINIRVVLTVPPSIGIVKIRDSW